MRLRLHNDEDVTIRLEKTETGAITGDITPHQDVEIINPDLVIANLTGSDAASFSKWISAQAVASLLLNNKTSRFANRYHRYRGIYSPVVRVAFEAIPTRLGKRTDYEKLNLEIWTDGGISPELALVEATNILRKP